MLQIDFILQKRQLVFLNTTNVALKCFSYQDVSAIILIGYLFVDII